MVHSGSRNLGLQVANHYNILARELNHKYHSAVPLEWNLAFLPVFSSEGQAYLREMQYCVDYAHANRALMHRRIKEAILQHIPNVDFDNEINIAHNYARLENHFGHNVYVHRKGATSAREGEIGIIPGSQGTSSYIVRGKGNRDSFCSCSHGAGRKMGRKAAQRDLNFEEEKRKLDEQGIVHGIRSQTDLDEASGAYKDINVIMKEQADLVDILEELKPLGVVKG